MSFWSKVRGPALAVALLVTAAPAFALDFSAADNLYSKRENNRAVIGQARQAYLDLLGRATSAGDKVRAVEQLGRLALYEGELLLGRDKTDERRKIFGDCWCQATSVIDRRCVTPGFIDKISPAALGQKVPAYYYFKGVCSGYWGLSANVLERATFSSELRDTVNDGLALGTEAGNYEGGGIHRVAANVWSNPEARAVGLYDIKGALDQINKALAAPAVGGADAGSAFYDNARSKVNILQQLDADEPGNGWHQQAVQYVDDTLGDMADRISQNQLPNGRAPEFMAFYGRLKADYQTLTGKAWPASN